MKAFNDKKATTPVFSNQEKYFKTIYESLRLNTNYDYLQPFLRDTSPYGQGIKAITLGFTKPLDFEQSEGAYQFKIIEPENEQALITDNHKTKYKVSYDKNMFDMRSQEEKDLYLAEVIKTCEDGHIFSMKQAIQYILGAKIKNENDVFSPNLKTLLSKVKTEFENGKTQDVKRMDLLATIRKISFDLNTEAQENTFSKTKTNYSYVPTNEQILIMSQSTHDELLKVPTTQLPEKYTLPVEPLIIPNIPNNFVFIGDKRILNIFRRFYQIYQEFNSDTLLYNITLHVWDWIGVLDIYAGKRIKITD